jgi:hypothetical protein
MRWYCKPLQEETAWILLLQHLSTHETTNENCENHGLQCATICQGFYLLNISNEPQASAKNTFV